jgi:hypothetical protein
MVFLPALVGTIPSPAYSCRAPRPQHRPGQVILRPGAFSRGRPVPGGPAPSTVDHRSSAVVIPQG